MVAIGNNLKQTTRKHSLDWAESRLEGVELGCVVGNDTGGEAVAAKELNV